jgi:molybdopterin molybdotransferase
LHVDRTDEVVASVVTPIDGVERVPLRKAAGRVLRIDVSSAVPVPPFDHSAVDGYGLRSGDVLRPETLLPIVASVRAGELSAAKLAGAAIRIMTGAPVPLECDSVVKQENASRIGESVLITDAVRTGANIRRRGEDVAASERIVASGTLLDTRHIALLAACGVAKVSVAPRARVAIAAFGNELRRPGGRLRSGQVFDSNSAMATAFLSRPCSKVIECVRLGDDRVAAAALLRDLAADADLIVTSGGMAVGDEDHARSAVEQAGGCWRTIRFAMKPGKPASLGRLGQAVVLGLPGNPFAALVALMVLGLPALRALTGSTSRSPEWLPVRSAFSLERYPGHTEFFPARIVASAADGTLSIERLGKGGSARLRPLVDADGLGRLDSEKGAVAEGDRLKFRPFASIFG